jgi:hypothetical protein
VVFSDLTDARYDKYIYPDSRTQICKEFYPKGLIQVEYGYVFAFEVTSMVGNDYAVASPVKPEDESHTKSRAKRKRLYIKYKKVLKPYLTTSKNR